MVQTEGGRTRLYYSWNGATEVASYRIYGSRQTDAVNTLLGTQAKTAFEMSVDVTSLVGDYCYFRVVPIDRHDQAMTPSNVVAATTGRCHRVFLPMLMR